MNAFPGYLKRTIEKLQSLDARENCCALLRHVSTPGRLPRKSSPASVTATRRPGARVEQASLYQQLLAEAILQLPTVDRQGTEVVRTYLLESPDEAMQYLGRRLDRELETE
jgi:hypothetical protein